MSRYESRNLSGWTSTRPLVELVDPRIRNEIEQELKRLRLRYQRKQKLKRVGAWAVLIGMVVSIQLLLWWIQR